MGLFERSRKAKKNLIKSKSNLLDYNTHSLRATLNSILDTTLTSPDMDVDIEFDRLDEAIEVINTPTLQDSYEIVQKSDDSNVFNFRLKVKDFIL